MTNARSYRNRIWLAGNGGSSSIASHFASDLQSLGFDAICLTDNIPRLTALTNDYCWELVYEKQLTHFTEFDVLILISVHGGGKSPLSPELGSESLPWSQNLLLAAIEAKKRGGKILSLVGDDGGRLKSLSDIFILVPSPDPCYVEGLHSLLTHIICKRLKETETK